MVLFLSVNIILMISNKMNYKIIVYRGLLLFLITFLSQWQSLFAQEQSAEKKLIESFIIELTRMDTISAPFVDKYVVFNRKQESVNEIKRSLNEIKTNYLTNREKYLKPNIVALDFIPEESNAKYYGIQIDNDRSLNFAIESEKISSISLFQTSSYNTIVFF